MPDSVIDCDLKYLRMCIDLARHAPPSHPVGWVREPVTNSKAERVAQIDQGSGPAYPSAARFSNRNRHSNPQARHDRRLRTLADITRKMKALLFSEGSFVRERKNGDSRPQSVARFRFKDPRRIEVLLKG